MLVKFRCLYMDYLPVFLNIKQRDCLVVGGGEIAVRKIRLLLRAHARIHVVSPAISEELSNLLLQSPAITHTAESFRPIICRIGRWPLLPPMIMK